MFFTADTHFSHTNIIKYCNRPFANVKEMNMTIINNWNSVVGKDDVVWHLGDFAFTKFDEEIRILTGALNGKINLVVGNHDKYLLKRKHLQSLFNRFFVLPYHEVNVNGIDLTLSHYAMRVWNKSHYGSVHLFGHSHDQLEDLGTRSFDTGVDSNNFTPVSLDKMKEKTRDKTAGILKDHYKKALS